MVKLQKIGLVTEIELYGEKVLARIDTGATRSSIDSSFLKKLGKTPSNRKIKVRSTLGVQERPLVRLSLKLNDSKMMGDFTVANRLKMKYLVLIGQNILKRGGFLIDPNKK